MNGIREKEKPVVMIVDDNPKNIQLVGSILRANVDCDFSFASDGKQALELIEKNLPDLILMDVMMPKMNGFEACMHLKGNGKLKNIPVIFLTAKVESDDVVKGFECGAVDYVSKPFVPSELLSRVKTQLKLKEKNDLIQKQNDERKQLLHVLCHDLTTPFSSLISCLELVSEPDMFWELKDDLVEVANNGLNIIELIRRMRSLDEKGLQMDEEPVYLNYMISRSLNVMKQRIASKNIEVNVDISPEAMIRVEAVSFVNSVINNLISNAVKFSFPGGIIDISGKNVGQDVILEIEDYGIGMPQVLCDNLFDIRKATSRPGTEGELGTGFGMPLVKKFVESYGGAILVSSKEKNEDSEGHGTIVEIILPNPSKL